MKNSVGPQSDWFKFPKSICRRFPELSASAVMVYGYIACHSWGFQEKSKRISIAEFQKGRRLRGGGSIDAGTGLSRMTIITAIKLLVELELLHITKITEHGSAHHVYELINFETNIVVDGDSSSTNEDDICDERKMLDELVKISTPNNIGSTAHPNTKIGPPPVQKLDRPSLKIGLTYKKDTLDRKVKKEITQACRAALTTDTDFEAGFFPSANGVKQKDASDIIAGKLYDILRKRDVIYKPVNLINWAKKIRNMFDFTNRSAEDVLEILEWFGDQPKGKEYLPVVKSADTFLEKYPNLVEARNRSLRQISTNAISDEVADARILALYEKAMSTKGKH